MCKKKLRPRQEAKGRGCHVEIPSEVSLELDFRHGYVFVEQSDDLVDNERVDGYGEGQEKEREQPRVELLSIKYAQF